MNDKANRYLKHRAYQFVSYSPFTWSHSNYRMWPGSVLKYFLISNVFHSGSEGWKKACCNWKVMYNMSAEITVHYLSFKYNNYNILILLLKILSILNGVFNFNGNKYSLCSLKWCATHLKFQNYSFSLQTTSVWDYWLNHIRKGADCKCSCRTTYFIHEFHNLQIQILCEYRHPRRRQ